MICLCPTLLSLSGFTIQHILTIFFLSEFSFEPFIILFVAVFIYRPTATIVQRVQRTKLDSESFVNVYQFIHDLYIVFKKNSSIKDLIYPFCLSKCFGRNNIISAKNYTENNLLVKWKINKTTQPEKMNT